MRVDASQFLKGIKTVQERHKAALTAYGQAAGNKMVAYAKRNRPWQDRTHSAKNTITASVNWQNKKRLRIGLHSGVHYSIYLERRVFRHKGRLAIWFPTIKALAPEILEGWANRLKEG